MEDLSPWTDQEARIQPYYPRADNDLRPCPLEAMLRVHWVQLLHNLSAIRP